jgi:hypothetical protein
MSLQGAGEVYGDDRPTQFHVDSKVGNDSQFPFSVDDEYVIRVVDEAVVITPPDYEADSIDLPNIDPDLLPDS